MSTPLTRTRRVPWSLGTRCRPLKGVIFGLRSEELFSNDARDALRRGGNEKGSSMNKESCEVRSQGRTHSGKDTQVGRHLATSTIRLHPGPKTESRKHAGGFKPASRWHPSKSWRGYFPDWAVISLCPEATDTETAKVQKVRWKLCFLQNELASSLPFLPV